MNHLFVTTALVLLASAYCERTIAQTVKPATAAPKEEFLKGAAEQKKAAVEFNSRRLLRFHQLWNLYLVRNENAARTMQSQVDAMIAEDAQPAIDEEEARAAAENREPNKDIAVTLSPETSKVKAQLKSKVELNETARTESNTTRLVKVHAGLEPEKVSLYIEADAKILAKHLRAEIAAGGENAEKAKANLAYLQGTLLPKLRDPMYFSVSGSAFAKEFGKVIGTSGASTSR